MPVTIDNCNRCDGKGYIYPTSGGQIGDLLLCPVCECRIDEKKLKIIGEESSSFKAVRKEIEGWAGE